MANDNWRRELADALDSVLSWLDSGIEHTEWQAAFAHEPVVKKARAILAKYSERGRRKA